MTSEIRLLLRILECPPWSKEIYGGEKCKLWPTLSAVLQTWHWMRQTFGYFKVCFMISNGENTLFQKSAKKFLVQVKNYFFHF